VYSGSNPLETSKKAQLVKVGLFSFIIKLAEICNKEKPNCFEKTHAFFAINKEIYGS
jgi:hypothetical protein